MGAKRKATPWDGFGNKDVVTLQTLVMPIDLAYKVLEIGNSVISD